MSRHDGSAPAARDGVLPRRLGAGTARGQAARIDALTGVRILAAAAVFLSHTSVPIDIIPKPLSTFMGSGYVGVTLFFVLSGFVLAWNYGDRMATFRWRSVWSFAVARFARIYPLYLFALFWAVAPLIATGTLPRNVLVHVAGMQAWYGDIFSAMAYNAPAWSVSVEIFLYACFPVVIVGLARIRHSPGALLAVIGLALTVGFALAWWFQMNGRGSLGLGYPTSAHRWLYRTPVTRLGDFVVGAAVALLVRHGTVRARAGACAQVVGFGSFIGLMCWEPMMGASWSWDAAYLLPAALMLWGLATSQRTWLARFLATPTMVLLGEASFAFYLFHHQLLGRLVIGVTPTAAGWLFGMAVTFVMILMLSVGVHFLVERPAQRWLRRTLDRRPRATVEDLTRVAPLDQVLI